MRATGFGTRRLNLMDKRIESAKALEAQGDIIRALCIYRDAYQQDPGHLEAIEGIAQTALALGNLELAFEFFVKMLILDHQNPAGYIGRANVLFQYGQTDRALSDLARAISLDEPPSELRIDCAAVLNDNGFTDIALKTLRPIRKQCLDITDFQCEWAFALLVQNKTDHEDLARILDHFRQNEADDPFYTLCLDAFDLKTGRCDTLTHLETVLAAAPELEARAALIAPMP
ncbi:MAG: hypothetical protein IKY83_13960 [Proteobacteria bacterium]|nr:hypothetical protein [Pseudomonadota bacterium]